MPPSYVEDRWGRLFCSNLPNLVKYNLLDFKSLYNNVEFVKNKGEEEYATSDSAVIYLPFCCATFKQIYCGKDQLFEWFTVSFDCDKKKNILMAATHRIPELKMEELGKELYQENTYSVMTRQMLTGIGGDGDGALNIFDSIRDVDEVRMIKLTALRKHHPQYAERRDWPCSLGVSKGGYVGLIKSI